MATIAASHLLFCKLNFILAITSKIKRATKVNIKLAVIVNSQYLGQGDGFDNNKPTYKTQNIYNIKAKIHCKNLDALSLIQTLMQKLDGFSWLIFLLLRKYRLANFFIKISHFKKMSKNA